MNISKGVFHFRKISIAHLDVFLFGLKHLRNGSVSTIGDWGRKSQISYLPLSPAESFSRGFTESFQ